MNASATSDADFLDVLKAEHEIEKAIMRYARGSDRKDYEMMRSAYHDDAIDNHGPYNGDVEGFFAWSRQHHERYDMFMHLMGNPNIDVEGDIAYAETYCLLFQQMKPEKIYASDVAPFITVACRYLDRFEKRGGVWKIAERNVVVEWIKKEWNASLIAPAPGIAGGFQFGRRSSEDLVYRMRKAPEA